MNLNLADRVFLGEAIFETLRILNATPLYAKYHWQRMHDSATKLKIPFHFTFNAWLEVLEKAIADKNMQVGGLKIILSAGVSGRGLAEYSKESWFQLICFDYQPKLEPVELISNPWLRDSKNPIYQHKTVNYLEAILASRYAKDNEATETLFFNLDGLALETTIANLFIVKNNQVFTPSLALGILPGITRQRLITHCKEQGIVCLEAEISKEMVIQAEAMFTTNSLQGIRLVSSFDGFYFNLEHPLIERLKDFA